MSVTLGGRVDGAARDLAPGYFAVVMASGIISAGLLLQGWRLLSEALLAATVLAFAVLVALTGWRAARHPDALQADLVDPQRAFGFFTFVAGANVLGVRAAMSGLDAVNAVLLAVAGVAWLVLGYLLPWLAATHQRGRPSIQSANGTWFVWAVASQSMAVAAATLEPHTTTWRPALAVLAVLAWSVGAFLYAAVGLLVGLRMALYPLAPEDLTPPYWVAMGASAITVLAGARIVEMASTPMVAATQGLVAGASVVFWAFATWLIPALVAAGVWRHVARRVPLRYSEALWSIVFPLGMYAVAGIYLGKADRLPLVGWIGGAELWVAVVAWALVGAWMLAHGWRTVLAPSAARRPG